MEQHCGIYMIQNNVNGKIYIGQSINIYSRWKSHLTNKNRLKYLLYKAFNKYGVDKFSFSIIEECPKTKLNEREAFYIKLYHSTNSQFGYNLLEGGYNHKWNKELKEKHSEILLKVHNTKEFKEQASKRLKQLWQDTEFKTKICNSRKHLYLDENLNNKKSLNLKTLWQDECFRNLINKQRNKNSWQNKQYRINRAKAVTDKSVLIKCVDTNKTLHLNEWVRLGFTSVKFCCEGYINTCKGLYFEYANNPLTEEQKAINKLYNNNLNNNRNKRLCLDPITNKPISYGHLCRKKRENELYKNIVLKDCIISEKELKQYTDIRDKLRNKPYTFSNGKERYNFYINKHKKDEVWVAKQKQRDKLKREALYKDPITNEIIRYDKLIYRKRTKEEYKGIILKNYKL